MQVDQCKCSGMSFSEAVLVTTRMLKFVRYCIKRFLVVGEKRLIIRFKNRYLASNFHFIGNNTMLNEQVYDMGEWFGNKQIGLLRDCHWNLVVASGFAWKKCFRNFSDLMSWVVGLKNIDCVKEPLRKLRCEADHCIPLVKSGPMLEK